MSVEQLGALIQTIAQAAMGDSPQPSSSEAADRTAFFEQLSEAVRRGDRRFLQELVETEQQTRQGNAPTLLMAVVMEGRADLVQALVATGADVNVRIEQFFRFDALQFAVDQNNIAIAQILLDAGADPNWNDPGFRPLTKAIKAGNVAMLQVLLHGGAEVVFQTGFKPLVEAAQSGNPEIIQLLLNAGCEVDAPDYSGMTALGAACNHCHVDAIRVLIAAGADVNQDSPKYAPPLLAVFGAPLMAKALSGLLGEQPDPTSSIPLAIATLIRAGANPNVRGKDGSTPLILAATQGYTEVVRILLDAGANPNAEGTVSLAIFLNDPDFMQRAAEFSQATTALTVAAIAGHTDIVAALLAAGADVTIADKKGRTALELAVQQGHTDIVQLLQRAGAAAPEGTTQFSEAALLGAAKQGNVEAVRSALQAGINPNTSEVQEHRKPRHKTALMFAAERGHSEAVWVLLDAGADVNLSDRPGKKLGKTPLMVAAEADHAEIVRLLLEAGAMVDAQDKRGETALFYAVQEKSIEAVRVLLEFGADPHKKSWDGTPFEQATYANPEIATLVMAADKDQGRGVSQAAREEMLRSVAFNENMALVSTLVQEVTKDRGLNKV